MATTNEELMQSAIEYGKATNPVWPFAALVIDSRDNILIKATDCAHISPLYHAESLAMHLLASELERKNYGDLTLITTAEPDVMSISSVHWANVVHEVGIKKVVYGCSLEKIEMIWPFGIKICAKEVVEKASNCSIKLIGPVLESESYQLFLDAKERQQKINKQHPARGNLSTDLNAFFELNVSV